MSRACLVDMTKCIGCKSCQVACKQSKNLPADHLDLFPGSPHYENPVKLSPQTFTAVEYNEIEVPDKPARWVFAKRQCMHCLQPSCASACPVKALRPTHDGAVTYNESVCIGCRYCMIACPFNIPKFEYEKLVPSIRKCTFCIDPLIEGAEEAESNGGPVAAEQRPNSADRPSVPSCVKACPANAIMFGERYDLLTYARSRIRARGRNKYIQHIFGEFEAGGTGWLYLSSEPFENLRFDTSVGTTPYPEYTKAFLTGVPLVIILGAGLMTAFHWVISRRDELAQSESGDAPAEAKRPAETSGRGGSES